MKVKLLLLCTWQCPDLCIPLQCYTFYEAMSKYWCMSDLFSNVRKMLEKNERKKNQTNPVVFGEQHTTCMLQSLSPKLFRYFWKFGNWISVWDKQLHHKTSGLGSRTFIFFFLSRKPSPSAGRKTESLAWIQRDCLLVIAVWNAVKWLEEQTIG